MAIGLSYEHMLASVTPVIKLHLGRGLRIFHDPIMRKLFLSRALYTTLGFIFLFSSYTTVSQTFWLRFLPPITYGLPAIGTVIGQAGSTNRKTKFDTLWLPVFSTQSVFDGDFVATEKDSTIEVELTKDLRFTVEPQSLIKIKLTDGKLLLRLSKGEVRTQFATDQTVFIKKGARIDEVIIRKGSYLIKNDTGAGIQITTFTQELKTTTSLNEQARAKAQLQGDDTADEPTNGKSSRPKEKSAAAQAYDLPTPREGTVFLMRGPQDVLIGAKTNCPDKCTLHIFKDQQEIKSLEFLEGEPCLFRLERSEIRTGLYSWAFSSQTFDYNSNFSIQEFTAQALANAIENGSPTEVLGE